MFRLFLGGIVAVGLFLGVFRFTATTAAADHHHVHADFPRHHDCHPVATDHDIASRRFFPVELLADRHIQHEIGNTLFNPQGTVARLVGLGSKLLDLEIHELHVGKESFDPLIAINPADDRGSLGRFGVRLLHSRQAEFRDFFEQGDPVLISSQMTHISIPQ